MIDELFKYNCSTIFLLKPITGAHFSHLENDYGLINSYLKDKLRDEDGGDNMYILFKPHDFEQFEQFLNTQEYENIHFKEDYDYAGGYVVLIYKIPDHLQKDFELFKQGKYSKLSKFIRGCYDKTVKVYMKHIPTFQWDVFSQNEKFRKEIELFLDVELDKDAELWSIPDMVKETLDIEKIKTIGNGKKSVAKSTR